MRSLRGSGCGPRWLGEGHGQGEGVGECPWLPSVWERVKGAGTEGENIAGSDGEGERERERERERESSFVLSNDNLCRFTHHFSSCSLGKIGRVMVTSMSISAIYTSTVKASARMHKVQHSIHVHAKTCPKSQSTLIPTTPLSSPVGATPPSLTVCSERVTVELLVSPISTGSRSSEA